MNILDELFKLQDKKYAVFQAKLTPGINIDRFIGVRVPDTRKLAKQVSKAPEAEVFMHQLPHTYYDENMLHGLLIAEIKDYDKCIEELELFLPYVDNWAVCDTMSPKVFRKYKNELLVKIKEWCSSSKVYTCRFGMGMLMRHYLDDNFQEEYLEIPANVISDEYYVNMMIAWFFATALTKQWESAIKYIEDNKLSIWVHNKTIQKACESYRITDDEKAYLKNLRRK